MEQGRQKVNIRNEDIKEISSEIPEGHRHIRTTIVLHDGTELIFQEVAVANMLRAYVTVKTHPQKTAARLLGQRLEQRKEGYAEWQLIEE